MVIPCREALCALRSEVIFGGKIDDSQALPLKDRAPLFDRIHPRTMHGRAVHHNARMVGEPWLNFLPMMRPDVVAPAMDGTDARINLQIQRFQKGQAFPLPLPVIPGPIDLARPGVEGRNPIAGTRARILVLNAVGPVVGLGGQGRGAARPRLQGSLLSHGAHQLSCTKRARLERDALGDRGREGRVPWRLGSAPDMLAPRLQLRRGQHPAHGGGGDVRHDPPGAELPRQFGAIPLGQAAAQWIRAFAGQA